MIIKGVCTHVVEIQAEDDPEIGYHTEICGRNAEWDIHDSVRNKIDCSCNEHLGNQVEVFMLLHQVEYVIVDKSGISV